MATTFTTKVFTKVNNISSKADKGKMIKVEVRKAGFSIMEDINRTTGEIFYSGKFYGSIIHREERTLEEIKEYIPEKDLTYSGYTLPKDIVEEIMDSVEDLQYKRVYTIPEGINVTLTEWNDIFDGSLITETLWFEDNDFTKLVLAKKD